MDVRVSDADLAAGRRLMARLDAFAAFTDEPRRLTRLFLGRASTRRAGLHRLVRRGRPEREIDAAGNVAARYEGKRAGAPALMLGSHIDTVRDAGRYDGNYGALAALAVVEQLARRRAPRSRDRDRRLRRRGGRSLSHDDHRLARARRELSARRARPEGRGRRHDARGADRRSAAIPNAPARSAPDVAAFVEVHIEQGPVLEAEGLPLGVVTAINGATRLVGGDGVAGHAGCVPDGFAPRRRRPPRPR